MNFNRSIATIIADYSIYTGIRIDSVELLFLMELFIYAPQMATIDCPRGGLIFVSKAFNIGTILSSF